MSVCLRALSLLKRLTYDLDIKQNTVIKSPQICMSVISGRLRLKQCAAVDRLLITVTGRAHCPHQVAFFREWVKFCDFKNGNHHS